MAVAEKEFKVRTSPRMGSLKEVYIEGGGEVPGDLSGLYTDEAYARKDINHYLNTRRNRSYRKKDE